MKSPAMAIRKGYASALAFLVLACLEVPQALDLAKADEGRDEKVATDGQARSSWRLAWPQHESPGFSSWLLQKLLDDSLEFFAFGCCVCWVCSHASHNFFNDKASLVEWDSREMFWEFLPFFILVFGSVILLLTLGAAASWDVPPVLLIMLPVAAFALRRCPRLLKWLLCCGLFLQILHHGVEHAQSQVEMKPFASIDVRGASNQQIQEVTQRSLRLGADRGTNYQYLVDEAKNQVKDVAAQVKEASQLLDRTRQPEKPEIEASSLAKLKSQIESTENIQEKEIAMLKSTLDVQGQRIQALTNEITMLNLEKEVQAKTIQALTDRNEYLEHSKIIR